jgi:hypothetical protein
MPKVSVVCQNPACQKTFLTYPIRIKQNKAKFCSKACQHYKTPEERFWEKVDTSGGPEACWLWIGGYDSNGYGSIDTTRAHIFSWQLHYGPIPSGILVCHTCDNPPCVRPDHLFLGTNGDNTADAVHKGRMCHGAAKPSAKLTEPQVYEIRELQGALSAAETGRRYHVSYVTVLKIWSREKWRYLPERPRLA